MLGTESLRAGRSTSEVTRGLGFCGLIRMIDPLCRLLHEAGGIDDLFLTGSPWDRNVFELLLYVNCIFSNI